MIIQKKLKEKFGNELVYSVSYSHVKNLDTGFTPYKDFKGLYDTIIQNSFFALRYRVETRRFVQKITPFIIYKNNETFLVFENDKGLSFCKPSYILSSNNVRQKSDLQDLGPNFSNPASAQVIYDIKKNNLNASNCFLLGYIKDLDININSVGLVYFVEVEMVNQHNNTKSLNFDELVENYGYFDDWSKQILDYMYINRSFEKDLKRL